MSGDQLTRALEEISPSQNLGPIRIRHLGSDLVETLCDFYAGQVPQSNELSDASRFATYLATTDTTAHDAPEIVRVALENIHNGRATIEFLANDSAMHDGLLLRMAMLRAMKDSGVTVARLNPGCEVAGLPPQVIQTWGFSRPEYETFEMTA